MKHKGMKVALFSLLMLVGGIMVFAIATSSAHVGITTAQQSTSGNTSRWIEVLETVSLSITTTMQLSEDAFEASVVDVSAGRFNTPNGTPPLVGSPDDDDDELNYGWPIRRYVTLDITTRYKGNPSVTRAVVVARGGGYDGNADGVFEYFQESHGMDLIDVQVGDQYMIYGLYPWTVPPAEVDAAPWAAYALNLAEQLNGQGPPTVYLDLYGAYKIHDGLATSITHHRTMPISVLRELTEQLSN